MTKQMVIILFLLLLVPLAHAKTADHVVFDLDWTLINPVGDSEQIPDFIVHELEYRIVPYVAESLLRLHLAGYQVSFYSGSKKSRVTEIANNIYKKVHALAILNQLDSQFTSQLKPYQLFSEDDLELNPQSQPTDRFRNRYYKNLLSLTDTHMQAPYFTENNVIAVDDIPEFARPDQGHLFLTLQPTFNNYDTYTDAQNAKKNAGSRAVQKKENEQNFIPSTRTDWATDRGRIAWATEVLIRAKQISEQNRQPLWHSVAQLTVDPKLSFNFDYLLKQKVRLSKFQESRTERRQKYFYLKGAAAAKRIARGHISKQVTRDQAANCRAQLANSRFYNSHTD